MLNEAGTEFTIVDPIMTALGYTAATLDKQDKDRATRTIPDYTLLHGSKKWFLEVKRLDLTLTDVEAAQAVSYAINHGAAWAVLTNGRSWYVYRAHLPRPLPEKRVFVIDDVFEHPEAVDVLRLLSRASMEKDDLTRAWKATRIHDSVCSELRTANSSTRARLREVVAETIGESVADADLEDAIQALLRLPSLPEPDEEKPKTDTSEGKVFADVMPPGDWRSLEHLAGHTNAATGKRPTRLYIMGSGTEEVTSWKALIKPVVAYLGSKYHLPDLPYRVGLKGKRCFVNTEPKHSDGKEMTAPVEVTLPRETVHVEAHWSARDLLKFLYMLQSAVQALPEQIYIEVAS